MHATGWRSRCGRTNRDACAPDGRSRPQQRVDADAPVVRRFVFAYVDIFGFYRPDYRADIEAGNISGFTIGQTFLAGTTLYVAIPSLMVFLTLVLRPRINRVINIALSILYGLTIVAGAIGEWNYYLLGSAIELALLAAIVHYAWTWPSEPTKPAPRQEGALGHIAISP